MSRSRNSRSAPEGFDYSIHMRNLCADLVQRVSELRHIDLQRVAVCFAQARKPVSHGLQATLTPMRFERGSLTTKRGGRRYSVQRLFDSEGRELLYILTFYLPRFQDQPFDEKLSTVIHELWHISPNFEGDLRRHAGRCYVHGRSQEAYDANADRLAKKWLSLGPPLKAYAFLKLSFRELTDQYGRVYGQKVATPKLIPLAG